MLRHCPITRFSSSGARRKMPNAARGKETLHVPLESQLDPADTKDIAKEQLPPQKVLKIFSINIIAQGLPFCRKRVCIVWSGPANSMCWLHVSCKIENVKSHPIMLPHFIQVAAVFNFFSFVSCCKNFILN